MNTNGEVAHGYVVLLGGTGPEQTKGAATEKDNLDESQLSLGFMALTEGNVVDACFGVHLTTKKNCKARQYAKEAKAFLAEAADSSDNFRRLAVNTYRHAFEIVFEFQEEVNKLNFFTVCFFYRGLQRKAESSLKRAFEDLQEATEAAT